MRSSSEDPGVDKRGEDHRPPVHGTGRMPGWAHGDIDTQDILPRPSTEVLGGL